MRVIRNADVTREGQLAGWANRFFSPKEASRALLQLGDTVLCTSGEVGKAYLVEEEGLAATNFTRILRPKTSVVQPAFLRLLLDSPTLRQEMTKHIGATTLANLRASFYSSVTVALPPLAEQRWIVDLLDSLFESIDSYIGSTDETIKHAQDLRSGLLSDLLSGNHEIPESYDALLKTSRATP